MAEAYEEEEGEFDDDIEIDAEGVEGAGEGEMGEMGDLGDQEEQEEYEALSSSAPSFKDFDEITQDDIIDMGEMEQWSVRMMTRLGERFYRTFFWNPLGGGWGIGMIWASKYLTWVNRKIPHKAKLPIDPDLEDLVTLGFEERIQALGVDPKEVIGGTYFDPEIDGDEEDPLGPDEYKAFSFSKVDARANIHLPLNVVEGNISYKSNLGPGLKGKLLCNILATPDGLSIPSYSSYQAQLQTDAFLATVSFDSKELQPIGTISSSIPLILPGDTQCLVHASTKMMYEPEEEEDRDRVPSMAFDLTRKLPTGFNVTSAVQAIFPLWDIAWRCVVEGNLKGDYTFTLNHNFGVEGLVSSFRWKRDAGSIRSRFATGISLYTYVFVLKMRVDQDRGFAGILRIPFFFGSLTAGFGFVSQPEDDRGPRLGLAWDIGS